MPGFRNLQGHLHEVRLRANAALWRCRARASGGGRGIVLYYHRIAAPTADPWRLAVSPATFEQHLELFASEMRVLPLAELAEARRNGAIPERAMAITFDDGYVDNLAQGLPLLERHGLPATFYIATGLIGTPGPMWWDDLADILVGPGSRPEVLDVQLGGTRVTLPTGTMAEREHALFGHIRPMLKELPPAAIAAAIEPLRAWADRDPALPGIGEDGLSEHRPMTVAELERLASSDRAELGAHTALHSSLPALPLEAMRSEILASRDMLTELVGSAPRSFAYPYGDNDSRSRRAVREAGFEHAVGVQEFMPVTTAAREFEIPRMMPLDEPAAVLERRMSEVRTLGRSA